MITPETNSENSIEPQNSEHDDFYVEQEQIKSKSGNYIFTVGNVTCGKSCLQHMIVHRLMKRRDIDLVYAHNDGNHLHDNILNHWVTTLDNGFLPDRTRAGYVQEFNIKIDPVKSKSLAINFMEISGEDIKTIMPSSLAADTPALDENLTLYLKSGASKIKKRFIFVADATRALPYHKFDHKNEPSEDILFNTLIEHLISKDIGLKKVNVLFLVAKWDQVQGKYKNARHFVSQHFPQTTTRLKSPKCHVTYAPFSVGDVKFIDDNVVKTPKVTRLETKYTDNVIEWIYQSFLGKRLPNSRKVQKSLLDKVKYLFGS